MKDKSDRMPQLEKLLSGGDLRSVGSVSSVISRIKSQKKFDQLFLYLFHKDRVVVMRAADAIEKITANQPSFLRKHSERILELCHKALHKELKWHLALLIARLNLDKEELAETWQILETWATDKTESRIVRVNSLQALFDLARKDCSLANDLRKIAAELEKENIPSINARIRLIKHRILP